MTTDIVQGVHVTSRIAAAAHSRQGVDWCEAFAISEHMIAMSIGDLCGHGPTKYRLMASLRRVIREAAQRGCDPAVTLAHANSFLLAHHNGEIATAVIAMLDTRRSDLRFANAGHPAPLMTNEWGAIYLEVTNGDLPLGVEAGLESTIRTFHLPADSLLVLYTDGVTEHRRDALRGASDLQRAVRSAYADRSSHTASVIETLMFAGGTPLDDAAILTARTPLTTHRHTFCMQHPSRESDLRLHRSRHQEVPEATLR